MTWCCLDCKRTPGKPPPPDLLTRSAQETHHTDFTLEATSLTEGSAEGEGCGSCLSPSAPQLELAPLPVEEQSFVTVDQSQDGEDIGQTATVGATEEMSNQDPNCEDMKMKDERLPFQIFPDPVEIIVGPETSSNSLEQERGKERLPSIVVEPTEVSEVESGELRWPPEYMDMEEDEEDLFLEQCIPPANIAEWGEEEEEEEEETSVILNQQQGLTLIDLQSDAFRDDTPTLPPSSTPAFN